MKKSVLIGIIFLILVSPLLIAEEDEISLTNETDDLSAVDRGYDCLNELVSGRCGELSIEEQIFSALAVGKCGDEIKKDSEGDLECWPYGGCKIKTTAQAILALDINTDHAQDWLLSKKIIPSDIIWYLQVDSNEETSCSVTYQGATYDFNIGSDKELSRGAGNCLSLSSGDYWFKINPTCYEYDFDITCSDDFITSLLYKSDDSSTIYVSEEISTGAAEGTTKERINSYCFAVGDKCDYEGSLWAAMVLDYKGEDVSSYMPYLITLQEENREYLPDSFIYKLTSYPDVRSNLLEKHGGDYWDESGDKFYDSAIAGIALSNEEVTEKTLTKSWLLDVQGNDGCFQGSIRNTAAVLYAFWPKAVEVSFGCESNGYYCMSGVYCEGNILDDYDCPGVSICCNAPKNLETCAAQGGVMCSSEQSCSGSTSQSSDEEFGETCCISGVCEEEQEQDQCEASGGICKSYCEDDEEEIYPACSDNYNICCKKSPKTDSNNLFWIILLLILCILVALAIIFRVRLRPYWHKAKQKWDDFSKKIFNKKSPPSGPPAYTPSRPKIPKRKFVSPRVPPIKRRIRTPIRRKPQELDDVLGKLRDIGK
jgi:hypothetical protein